MKMKVPLRHTAYRWTNYWIMIIEGLVGIITFTLVNTSWSYKHCLWFSKRQMVRKMKEQNL